MAIARHDKLVVDQLPKHGISVNKLTGPRSGRTKHAANQVDGGDLVNFFARSKGDVNSGALNDNFREYKQRNPDQL